MGVPWCWSVLVHRHSWAFLGAGQSGCIGTHGRSLVLVSIGA